MAIRINFDTANNPETPTLILATRDGNRLGQLEAKEVELSEKLIGASEITFIVNKYVDGRLTNLWDKIVDFKLVYCQEWDVWFEIRVEIDEDTKTVKTVFGTQLAQAELSQLMLYNIEINTEADIARDDYKISVLYDPDHPDASILHRLFEKAPHYRFGNIDGTIAKIQRSFSFDEISIYDALQEIAEEIGCLFIFHSGSDVNGDIERYISVHDLEQCCQNVPDCGYRGEFTDVCPKCGSTNIRPGYGQDTTIFVTADELASNNIQFVTDTDSVKNCFKLEAGDDLMTATIRNCNPNGTDYIWYFSDSVKQDMSQALRDKLTAYDAMYQEYHNNYEVNLDSTLLIRYNNLVNKYKPYNSELENISDSAPIRGYSNLMNAYYNVIDLSLYLESGLMPTVEMSGTTASQEAAKLTPSNLSPLAVTNLQYASVETVNSVALGLAKIFVKPTYKIEINGTSSLSPYTEGATSRTWTGRFTVTNYSDKEDTFTTNPITLSINSNAELFTKQKIEKALNKEDSEDYGIVGLFERSIHGVVPLIPGTCSCAFCSELKKYALKPLSSFRDACQACIDILIEQGATKDTKLYNSLYHPYWLKLKAIETEMKIRENEIADIDGVYDNEGNLIKKGLASEIEKLRNNIQDALNFEAYIGEALWNEFCSYRREDKYKNENYISDGLNNAELFTRALEFIDVANNEIYKSSELQHSISSTLKNLMAIEKFKPLAANFEVGNWMRVQLDDTVYKLRLLEYTIDFENIQDIPVVFSDVSKVRNGLSDLEDLFSQASSMTSHYDAVLKQASKGQAAQGTIEQWLQDGLNSALVQINNNNSEEVTITENGILCRSYDASTDSYSLEQLKLTHNILAYTNDDWMTVRQAIGKHLYMRYEDKETSENYDKWVQEVGYGISADFVTAAQVAGSTIVGGKIYSSNYSNGTGGSETPMGTYIDLETGAFSFGGDKFAYDGDTITLKNVTITWDDGSGSGGVNPPSASDIDGLDTYLNQLDGKISTYKQANDPSTGWTSDEKPNHIGDLWFDTNNGITKRWNGNSWDIITDKELEALAQSKAQIFTSTPTPPYNVGDLWVQGSTGDIYHCIQTRTSGSYVANDWVKSSKYTDDSALDTFINGTYKTNLEVIQQQIDKKAETWCQPNSPSWTGDERDEHIGDLWQDSDDNNKEYIYTKINNADGSVTYKWEESTVDIPDEVFDAIDGKAAIYVSAPTSQNVGDLLIPASTFTRIYGTQTYTFTQGKIYKCTTDANSFIPSYWVEVAYTDDTTALAAQSVAKEAKDIANAISTGIGFKTEIGGNYIISPVVGTCTLLIGDENGVYSKIDSQGNFTSNSATIIGTIKSGGKQYTKNGTAYYGHNFRAENGTIKLGLQDDGTYSMVVDSDGKITFSDDVILSFGGGSSGGSTPVTPPATGTTNNEDTNLRNALGWTGIQSTQISGRYVISPHIQGGYLYISDTSGTNYAQISNGVLTAQGAELHGKLYSDLVYDASGKNGVPNFKVENGYVYAGYNRSTNNYNFQIAPDGHVTIQGSLTIEGMGSGGSGSGSGSSNVYWNDILNKPTIPTSTSQLTNNSDFVNTTGVVSIINGTVKADFVNALGITATAVSSSWVYAGKVSANNISAGTITSDNPVNTTSYDLYSQWDLSNGEMTFKKLSTYTTKILKIGCFKDHYYSSDVYSDPAINFEYAVSGGKAGLVIHPNGQAGEAGNDYGGIINTALTDATKSVVLKFYDDSTPKYGTSVCTVASTSTILYPKFFLTRLDKENVLTKNVSCANVYVYNDVQLMSRGSDIVLPSYVNYSSNIYSGIKDSDGYYYIHPHVGDNTNGKRVGAIIFGNESKSVTTDSGTYSGYSEVVGGIVRIGTGSTQILSLNGKSVSGNSGISTGSDERIKTNISKLTEVHESYFNNLNPVSFKYINGTSDRTHYGFIAQQVRDAALNVGLTTQDIAMFVSTIDENDKQIYALRYDEFIALNTHMIQKCLKEIGALKSENETLKQQIADIKQAI